jgi:hypothetical protein
MIFIKKLMHWGTFKYFLKKLLKISFKNSFAYKSVFWEKKHVVLFQSNPFGSYLQVLTC